MDTTLIEAHGLTATFGAEKTGDLVRVLRGVDIDIPAGAMVAIVGPSGCGKTTLLYCLSGLSRPGGGRLTGFGRDMARMPDARLAKLYRTAIGFVFQDANLVGALSALENVTLPARLRRMRSRASKAEAQALLGRLGVGHRAGHLPAQLSSGEKQRVALARVLHQGPDVVFADEPTGALDSRASEEVLRILRTYVRERRSVVMVTHDIAAACQADVVFVMRDGIITHRLTSPSPAGVRAAMDEPEQATRALAALSDDVPAGAQSPPRGARAPSQGNPSPPHGAQPAPAGASTPPARPANGHGGEEGHR